MSFLSNTTNFLNKIAININQNKYFYGIMMLMLNLGSKYLSLELSSNSLSKILNSVIMRRLVIFSIIFISTRDIKISLIVTASFVILGLHLLNSKSKFCILPKSFKELDLNSDGKISPEEIEKAYLKLKKNGRLPSKNNKQ